MSLFCSPSPHYTPEQEALLHFSCSVTSDSKKVRVCVCVFERPLVICETYQLFITLTG